MRGDEQQLTEGQVIQPRVKSAALPLASATTGDSEVVAAAEQTAGAGANGATSGGHGQGGLGSYQEVLDQIAGKLSDCRSAIADSSRHDEGTTERPGGEGEWTDESEESGQSTDCE